MKKSLCIFVLMAMAGSLRALYVTGGSGGVVGTVMPADSVETAEPDFGTPPEDGGRPPKGKPGNRKRPPMGKPGGTASRTSKVSKTGISLSSATKVVKNQTFSSDSAGENAVQVSGGKLVLQNCRIVKNGADSKDGDGTSFYGTNAAVLVTGKGCAYMQGGSITTAAVGANGIVAYGGKAEAKDVVIQCTGNLSRGIHATGNGEILAMNLTITTEGNNSSVIATDRGGGSVVVNGGTYTAKGKDCAVCYSTGDIITNKIKGHSEQGEVAVVEGDNEVNINDCDMVSGDSRRGMLILQSGSGDATGNNGRINVTGGSVTLTDAAAPLIEITTSTQGTLMLKDVKLNVPSGVLLKADYNTRWSTTSPIAHLVLATASQTSYNGDVTVDKYATASVQVGKGVTWTGTYDGARTGKSTEVVVDGTWVLSADSRVDKVMINSGGVVQKNGHRLEYKTITNQGTIK